MEREFHIKRGDIFYVDFGTDIIGSEQGGSRPAFVVQNNIGNKHSPTVIVAPITKAWNKKRMPTHVFLKAGDYGLPFPSIILMEQLRTVDKHRFLKYVGSIDNKLKVYADRALCVSVGIPRVPLPPSKTSEDTSDAEELESREIREEPANTTPDDMSIDIPNANFPGCSISIVQNRNGFHCKLKLCPTKSQDP